MLSIFYIFCDEVRILTTVEPPTNYYLQNETFSGTTTDIIIEITRYLDLDTTIEVLPWIRAYTYSLKNPDIVIYTCGKTQTRVDHGFHFIGPVMTRKHALWSLKEKEISIENIDDIKKQNLNVVGMRGDWRSDFFSDQGVSVYNVHGHEYSLNILLGGRVDLWISSDIEAPQIAESAGIDIDELEMIYIFDESPSYIMMSRDSSAENIRKWHEAFKQLQMTDFFKELSVKWSKILGYDLAYDKDKGLYVE